MRLTSQRRSGLTTTSALGLVAILLAVHMPQSFGQAGFVQDGEAGFVVSDIEFALSRDAGATGACPDGMSLNVAEIYQRTPEGQRRADETDKEYIDRMRAETRKFGRGPNGENMCMHPETGGPDSYFRTVQGSEIPVYGIDLDGRSSENDFVGMDGEPGADNQFYRAVGCTHGFQPNGQANGFAIEMLTGAWGILVTVSDIDDIHNDDYVEVGLYANADPIQLGSSREPLEYASYAVDPDPRFQAKAPGRIVDGVLTSEPVDVRFRKTTNGLLLERPIRDARVEMSLSEDGILEGYLAGYAGVEELFDSEFGFRNALDGVTGEPVSNRGATGKARVLGYTCNGIYHAMYELADGHPDPETGRNTSVSIQYRIKAIPAFVLDAPDGLTSAAD